MRTTSSRFSNSTEFSGLRIFSGGSVYPPAEDSFMLAEHCRGLGGRILEMGTGSGIAAIANAHANPGNEIVAVDINPEALECAEENAGRNGAGNITFLKSDLFENVSGKFDAILFNPPYLPTSKEEKLGGEANRAYDGGGGGRDVTDRFLGQFGECLKLGGVLLIVQSSLSGAEETKRKLGKMGFGVETLAEEPFFFERLFLFRAQRTM